MIMMTVHKWISLIVLRYLLLLSRILKLVCCFVCSATDSGANGWFRRWSGVVSCWWDWWRWQWQVVSFPFSACRSVWMWLYNIFCWSIPCLSCCNALMLLFGQQEGHSACKSSCCSRLFLEMALPGIRLHSAWVSQLIRISGAFTRTAQTLNVIVNGCHWNTCILMFTITSTPVPRLALESVGMQPNSK